MRLSNVIQLRDEVCIIQTIKKKKKDVRNKTVICT